MQRDVKKASTQARDTSITPKPVVYKDENGILKILMTCSGCGEQFILVFEKMMEAIETGVPMKSAHICAMRGQKTGLMN